MDRHGFDVAPALCPWRCAGCGHINRAEHTACGGIILAEGSRRCRHLQQITGIYGAEFTDNDWVCPICEADDGQRFRMWVKRDRCRRRNGARMDMVGVRKVKDYPAKTVFG